MAKRPSVRGQVGIWDWVWEKSKIFEKSACNMRQLVIILMRCRYRNYIFRLLGQAVKTSPFHGGNTGSIPVGVIS